MAAERLPQPSGDKDLFARFRGGFLVGVLLWGFFQGSFRIVSFVCSFLFCLLNGALLSRNGKLHKTSFDDFLVSCSRGLALTYGQV